MRLQRIGPTRNTNCSAKSVAEQLANLRRWSDGVSKSFSPDRGRWSEGKVVAELSLANIIPVHLGSRQWPATKRFGGINKLYFTCIMIERSAFANQKGDSGRLGLHVLPRLCNRCTSS
ncbi:MAG: hypothetical protein CBB71_09255 [Rhodopirellula sp. TMED11]|nr:MAG: hypothetical protein CBB71_09255 [Rhodopirellula sp. TMED11]